MRPIYIYRLAVQTEHDSEELDAEEMEGAIRHELIHNNYFNVVGVQWLETINIEKTPVKIEGKAN